MDEGMMEGCRHGKQNQNKKRQAGRQESAKKGHLSGQEAEQQRAEYGTLRMYSYRWLDAVVGWVVP